MWIYDNMWISKKNKLSSANYPLVIKGLEAPTVSMGLSQNLHGLAEGHTPSVAALIDRSKCRLLQGWFIMGTGSGGSSPICRISQDLSVCTSVYLDLMVRCNYRIDSLDFVTFSSTLSYLKVDIYGEVIVLHQGHNSLENHWTHHHKHL